MTGFRSKTIVSDLSLGELLCQQRLKLGFSLPIAALHTKVSADYLQALECGKYNLLPGEIYAKNFLKKYADFLNLRSAELVRRYQLEQKVFNQTNPQQSPRPLNRPVIKVSALHLLVTPKLLRQLIIGALALACIVYLGFKIKHIFIPPNLQVGLPTGNIIVNQKIIDVTGQTEAGSVVKINGQQVLTDVGGAFAETLALQDGTNVIEISAQKKHSQPVKIYRQIVVAAVAN